LLLQLQRLGGLERFGLLIWIGFDITAKQLAVKHKKKEFGWYMLELQLPLVWGLEQFDLW